LTLYSEEILPFEVRFNIEGNFQNLESEGEIFDHAPKFQKFLLPTISESGY